VQGVPFLYAHTADCTNEDLKEITSQLMHKKPGFYCVTSTTDGKHLFMCTLDASLAPRIDMTSFALWLKDAHGLRGGGSKLMVQGGGAHIDANLGGAIREWLEKNVKA
jgi:alanyl-tRNA synthetase